MYYKIIVYKKMFVKNKHDKKIPYFKTVTTYHNIHKSVLTKNWLETWEKYKDTCYHITSILETENDTIIENYNRKAKKCLVI